VLEFPSTCPVTNCSATLVLGQANFTSGGAGTSASRLSVPDGVALDSAGNVYVADSTDSRVVEFPSTCGSTDCSATRVFGQTSFTTKSHGTTASTLYAPANVALDSSDNVYVADNNNNRVLEFPSTCANTGCSATRVFGQTSFTTGGHGTTASTLNGPQAVAVDSSGNIYVVDGTNNRVLEFPSTCASTGCSATRVFGQTSFTSATSGTTASTLNSPGDVALDGSGNIYVADTGNNRVLEFASSCADTGCAASVVFGQTSFTSGTSGDTATTLSSPQSAEVDSGGQVYVADTGNNRALGNLPLGSGSRP
jgi:sugar lactone lactonase YvrE